MQPNKSRPDSERPRVKDPRGSARGPERAAMREASKLPQPSIVDIDPEDPSQLLDEAGQFGIVDIEVEAQPHAEADADLDAAVATTAEDYSDIIDATDFGDVGDLYGVHIPRAADADLDTTDTREEFQDSQLGEHVFATLEKQMAEGGAAPEQELDIEDDSDAQRGHHKSDRRDRPVADRGSGGKGGL